MEIHRRLLEMPVWGYFLAAPLFTVANLVVASALVNALKRRMPKLQGDTREATKTRNVTLTLSTNYLLLAGFAGSVLYGLAHLPNVSWGRLTVLNTVLAGVLVLLGNDLLYYGYHRLMHTDYFWYRVHRVHHESTSPGGLRDTFYEDPLDFFFGTLCGVLPLAIVPVHISAAVTCLFLQTFLAVAYHSGYEIRIPAIFTARRHDDHHRYFRGNYAQNFALVDMLFGTVIREQVEAATPAQMVTGSVQ